jgi:ABC-type multidrug transport system fused ATPase/permease subunit
MGIEAFFKKHPLDKKVQEKGANLSIGEKQVISLARAMVLDQEVLVLDEATSNMDPHTERLITTAIKNLLRHKTVIIIAHRLSTVRNADRIMMISGGEVKELGTHDELLALGGLYSRYYRLQFGEGE